MQLPLIKGGPFVKELVLKVLGFILGRRNLWRLGRALYLEARADTSNKMESNGEQRIQREMLLACSTNNVTPVIFDVGANVGDWTIALLRNYMSLSLKNRMEVHCFEPVPTTFDLLRSRIIPYISSFDIRLTPKALSEEDGSAEMFVQGEFAGTNSLHRDVMQDSPSIPISTTTVHSYCLDNNVETIHFLKCDTEGHDVAVLYGAKQLFWEERIMTFQFEYNHRWVYSRHYLLDVFGFVKSLPYSMGKITPDGIEIYEKWHPELERFFEGNYIIIHNEALSWYSALRGTFDSSNTFVAIGKERR